MIVFKILALICWLVIIPGLVGFLPVHFLNNSLKSFDKAIIFGYIVCFALLEFVGIPVVLFIVYNAYPILLGIFVIITLFMAGFAVFITAKDVIRARKNNEDTYNVKKYFEGKWLIFKDYSIESKIYLVLIIAAILFQLIMAFKMASYDVDDAYYNTYATSAQSYGTLYRVDPNTGKSIPLDIRHGLALFPIFQAMISSLSGLHLLVIAHKVMPLLLIPLSYILVYEIAKCLFPQSREQRLMLMLLVNVFRVFGNVSEFTTETFFFMRTWQGKSVAGNFIIPAIIWLFLLMMSDKDNYQGKSYWAFISILILSSGASSSLAVLLCCLLTVVLGGLFAIKDKKIKPLIDSIISCFFGAIYILIYILN